MVRNVCLSINILANTSGFDSLLDDSLQDGRPVILSVGENYPHGFAESCDF